MAWMDDVIGQLMMRMQLQQLMGQTGSPGQTTVDQLNAFRRSDDNRDMQVRAPGQYQFPSEMFGLLLHPNAAGIYGRGERLPPAGDVVLPPPGYRDESSRNAYMPSVSKDVVLRSDAERGKRNFQYYYPPESSAGFAGFTRIGDVMPADPISQLMMQMQLQQLMGDRQEFMQRPPVTFGVESARPPEAWFENPSWLQGYPPESSGAAGMMQGPAPGPPGLSGSISSGARLRDVFGPYSPLRGTYRHTWQF